MVHMLGQPRHGAVNVFSKHQTVDDTTDFNINLIIFDYFVDIISMLRSITPLFR